MTSPPGTVLRTFRIEEELWDAYDRLVPNRSEDVRAYIAWRCGVPGAQPPARPNIARWTPTVETTEDTTMAADDTCEHGKVPADCRICNPILDPTK